MDPLSISASVVGLVSHALEINKKLRSFLEDDDIETEFGIYAGILSGVSKELLSTEGLDPALAAKCSWLCHSRLKVVVCELELRSTSKRPFKSGVKELKGALDGFTNAVKIFREVATECVVLFYASKASTG